MTIDELQSSILSIAWFSRLGQFQPRVGYRSIKSLESWSGQRGAEPGDDDIADAMDWLPTTREQSDPWNPDSSTRLRELPPVSQSVPLQIYKTALVSLRSACGDNLLKVGPHDFREAARGAALYACRAAAIEILTGCSSRWGDLIAIYAQGHWPCGLLPNGDVVVL